MPGAFTFTPDGSAIGPALAMGLETAIFVPISLVTGPADTYPTGGISLALPDSLDSYLLTDVIVTKGHDGTRRWEWNGDRAAPKLVAYDAFATEEGNGTNIFSITLRAVLVLK